MSQRKEQRKPREGKFVFNLPETCADSLEDTSVYVYVFACFLSLPKSYSGMLLTGRRVGLQRSTDIYLKPLSRRHRSMLSRIARAYSVCVVRECSNGSVVNPACDWSNGKQTQDAMYGDTDGPWKHLEILFILPRFFFSFFFLREKFAAMSSAALLSSLRNHVRSPDSGYVTQS